MLAPHVVAVAAIVATGHTQIRPRLTPHLIPRRGATGEFGAVADPAAP